jgi:hypothetical protein
VLPRRHERAAVQSPPTTESTKFKTKTAAESAEQRSALGDALPSPASPRCTIQPPRRQDQDRDKATK